MLSIIVPTLNEEHYLPNLLRSLQRQSYSDFEVIIADADSTDKTTQHAKDFGAKIVQGGTPAVGRNNGAQTADGSLLLFLDADVEFHDTFLEEILKEFNERKLDIASCYVSKDVDNKVAKAVYYIGDLSTRVRQYTKSPTGPGACILVKKEVHLNLKGFNQDKVFYEDWDYIKRAVKQKYKYRVLHNQLYISTRRFDNSNLVKLAVAAVTGTILIAIGIQSLGRISNMYGGWGKHKKGSEDNNR